MSDQFYTEWFEFYHSLLKGADKQAMANLGEDLMKFDLAYGLQGKRAAPSAHYAWLMTPPGYREVMAPVVGHFIVWLFGIDVLLDTCDQMNPAYDLLTVCTFAVSNLDVELTSHTLSQLPLNTNVDEIYPLAGCSVLTLGKGVQQVVKDVRALYPHHLMGMERFARELELEIQAGITEALWRVEQSWHGRTIDEYMALGPASIASIVTAALELLPLSDDAVAWAELRSTVWQVAMVCRLTNDIATVEREKIEGRANALLVDSPNESIALVRTQATIEQAANQLLIELESLSNSPSSAYVAHVLKSMAALALVMYYAGRDLEIPPTNNL